MGHTHPDIRDQMHGYMQIRFGNGPDRRLRTMTVDFQVKVAMLENIEVRALALLQLH